MFYSSNWIFCKKNDKLVLEKNSLLIVSSLIGRQLQQNFNNIFNNIQGRKLQYSQTTSGSTV